MAHAFSVLEEALIDRLRRTERAHDVTEAITKNACESCEKTLAEMTDEMIKWRRLALAYARLWSGTETPEDRTLWQDAPSFEDHIKLVEGGE